MFGKDDKLKESQDNKVEIPSREVGKTSETTNLVSAKASLISKEIKITGEITGSSDLDIYGSFDGTIKLENNNINVESTAKIKAEITAKTIRINGSITGNINAIEKITVTKNGSVVGDITAPKVEIQDGATFDGNMSMKKIAKK